VYNEEEVISVCYSRLKEVMEKSLGTYELIFVNDGSRDASVEIIKEICEKDKHAKLISLSRNFGHQNAITAGMDFAKGQAVIVIDADLQDPPAVILDMIAKWKEGYHVVYGKRKKRKGETLFKRASAKVYYRLLRRLTNVDIPLDAGDFRLIDRKVCDSLSNLQEKNRYIRGLVAWVGFKQTYVEYERDERLAGVTKYPLKKMIKFGIDGITSFSYKPLKLATNIGFLISIGSFINILHIIYRAIFTDSTIEGWASTMSVVLFSQGIVLIMLGLMGEYIGRIFEEMKGRPIYLIQEVVGMEEEEKTTNV